MKKILLFMMLTVMLSGIAFASSETVSWSATDIGASNVVTITATPSSTTSLTSWVVEEVNIPTGWSLVSATYSGGSGLGASGCNQEGSELNCASATSVAGEIDNSLTIKMSAPSQSSSATITGKYVTSADDASTKSGSLTTLDINGGGNGGTPSDDSESAFGSMGVIILIVIVGVVIFFMTQKK